MKVKILGSGCAKCETLAEKVRTIAESHNLHVEIEKITDAGEITSYGVLLTPGLVIDGRVKSAGKIPTDEDILRWLS